MHRSDGDLVDAGPFHRHERVLAAVFDHRRGIACPVPHRVPPGRPVLVEHETPRLGVIERLYAEQVEHLPFEPAGRE